MNDLLRKEPAALIGVALGVVAAIGAAVAQATTNGQVNWWAALVIALPVVTGLLVRAKVFSPQTVDEIEASVTEAATALKTINVVVNGSLLSEQELAESIRKAIQDGRAGA